MSKLKLGIMFPSKFTKIFSVDKNLMNQTLSYIDGGVCEVGHIFFLKINYGHMSKTY